MFRIPAQIQTVDYIGITNDETLQFRRRALIELGILYDHMVFAGLKQYIRHTSLGDNVVCNCRIQHGLAFAVVIVGATSQDIVNERSCFCAAKGVLSGVILALKDDTNYEEPSDNYENDESYYADIVICQKTGPGVPKKIETRTITASGNRSVEKIISSKSTQFYITDVIYNVPFTDHMQHMPGDLVLVLCMPLIDYRPSTSLPYGMSHIEKQGTWSPEINKREIVSYAFENPKAMITDKYIASTGMTNAIAQDSYLWDQEKDSATDTRSQEDLNKEIKYFPFRILPINIDSCLTGYK